MRENPRHLIVLSGDHVYKMDYARMLRVPPGARRGGHAGDDRSAGRRRPAASASSPSTSSERVTASRRSRSSRRRFPARRTSRWRRWASTSSTPTCWCARSKPTPTQPTTPRLRQGHHPGADPPGAGLRVPLLRREQEGVEVLARHRHARRLLRSEHGSLPGEPGVQPVRSGVAAAHLPAAGAAGQVRVRRGRAALRAGARLGHLARLHRLGQQHLRQRALPERARPQLLPHRAVHPDAGRARRPARAHPARDHRPRRADSARRADRLQRRRGSPPPHRHRLRHRRRHDRRRAAHRHRSARRRCASRRRPIAAAAARATRSKSRT